MNFTIDQLPADRSQIAHDGIRTPAEAFDAARNDAQQAKKDHTQAELELPASEWKDAKVEAAAIKVGKPAPKTRTHTAKHEQLIRDLAHKIKVTSLTEAGCREALQTALASCGADYLAQANKAADALDASWANLLTTASKLHSERRRATGIALKLGGDRFGVSAIQLDVKKDITGIEIPADGARVGHADVGIVLERLAALGIAEAEPQPVRFGIPAGVSKNIQAIAKQSHEQPEGQAARERAEREAQLDLLNRKLGEEIIAGRA